MLFDCNAHSIAISYSKFPQEIYPINQLVIKVLESLFSNVN